MIPTTSVVAGSTTSHILAGSGPFTLKQDGIEKDQNDYGGSCAKGHGVFGDFDLAEYAASWPKSHSVWDD